MKFFYMVIANCKKYFKDYKNILLMFATPILSILLVTHFFENDHKNVTSDIKVGIINSDKGSLGKEFIGDFKGVSIYSDKEKALSDLKQYSVISIYEIPENFTNSIKSGEKPILDSYKLEEGNNTKVFEIQLEEKLNKLIEVQILKNNNLISSENEINKNFINVDYKTEKGIMNAKDFMPIVLVMFFILIYSGSISKDLLILRKEKILERFSSTSNNGYTIMGSIYVSMIITQTILYIASFLVIKFAFGVKISNFGFLLLNIILMSMIAVSLAVMANRIFKDPGVSSLFITLISLIMFFAYFTGILEAASNKYPKILGVLSKFTPLYWALNSIEKSVLFPNIFVLILIALVFFTAGSIRYTNFAKES